MFRKFLNFLMYFFLLFDVALCDTDSCDAYGNDVKCESSQSSTVLSYQSKRYVLYEVNPGEGFNLRRDVYMRIATLVKKLNEDSTNKWTLVLPPWGPLYHWKSKNIGFQAQIKWSNFFNISSLSRYVPVVELEDFLLDNGSEIDVIYYLQHYAEGWTDGQWEERIDIRSCIDPPTYKKIKQDKYIGWFWGYEDLFAKDFHCVSVQGYSSTLKELIMSSHAKAIMVDRAEVILHDTFGDSEYWLVRQSMVFSRKLIQMGDTFRKLYLNSTDRDDKTERNFDQLVHHFNRSALGGPYIAVHLRRQDFAIARPKEVPSIEHAAQQILKYMEKLKLKLLFVATDAPESEFMELKSHIPAAVRFVPNKETRNDILDGGVAIIDQWICAHARFFIGTHESTFSYRIQEEREILGFPVETTFNRLCGNNRTICEQPAKWTIAFN